MKLKPLRIGVNNVEFKMLRKIQVWLVFVMVLQFLPFISIGPIYGESKAYAESIAGTALRLAAVNDTYVNGGGLRDGKLLKMKAKLKKWDF